MIATRLGKYELKEELGRGAMGIVYRAYDTDLHREVALKTMMLGSVGPEVADEHARFLREARSAARIAHPNIVAIYELGEDCATPYIAMELLEGTDLDELIRQRELPAIPTRLEWVAQLCDGLDFAHRSGIIHRDIKPANLFLTLDGTIKILDFGIAKLAHSDGTRTGLVIGTVDYMSPEQARGEKGLDGRSDLFAAGVLLYELLLDRRPFTADHVPATMYRIVNSAPPAQSHFRDLLGNELAAILDRALRKQPHERFRTGREMAQALRRAASSLDQRGVEEVERKVRDARTRQIFDQTGAAQAHATERIALSTAPATLIESIGWRAYRWAIVAGCGALLVVAGWAGGWFESPPQVNAVRSPSGTNELVIPAASLEQLGGESPPDSKPASSTVSAEPKAASVVAANSTPPVAPGRLALAVFPWAELISAHELTTGERRDVGESTPLTIMLPPGRWNLRLQHPRTGPFELAAEITSGAETLVRGRVPGIELREFLRPDPPGVRAP